MALNTCSALPHLSVSRQFCDSRTTSSGIHNGEALHRPICSGFVSGLTLHFFRHSEIMLLSSAVSYPSRIDKRSFHPSCSHSAYGYTRCPAFLIIFTVDFANRPRTAEEKLVGGIGTYPEGHHISNRCSSYGLQYQQSNDPSCRLRLAGCRGIRLKGSPISCFPTARMARCRIPRSVNSGTPPKASTNIHPTEEGWAFCFTSTTWAFRMNASL